MISIEVNYEGEKFSSLLILGHGGEEKGKDIYCAGVSSCLYGALNALNNSENYQYELKFGFAKIIKISTSTLHDEIVLETLITQLDSLANSYPKNIRIKFSKKEG